MFAVKTKDSFWYMFVSSWQVGRNSFEKLIRSNDNFYLRAIKFYRGICISSIIKPFESNQINKEGSYIELYFIRNYGISVPFFSLSL